MKNFVINLALTISCLNYSGFAIAQNGPIRLVPSGGVLNVSAPAVASATSTVPSSTPVVAAGAERLEQLSHSTENPSSYEILKQFFDEASAPAQLSDLEMGINSKNGHKECRFAYQGSLGAIIFVQRDIETGGTPAVVSNGPLFPGKPAVPGKIGHFLRFEIPQYGGLPGPDSVDRYPLDQVIKVIGRDLSAETSDGSLMMKFRRNGELNAFWVKARITGNQTVEFYGYCYKN